MSADHQFILEEVSRTSIQLLLKEPFYAHILASLNKQIVDSTSEIDTLALEISPNGYVLLINPTFWNACSSNPGLRYGLIKHELLHLIFKHLLIYDPEKDILLVNIAMDLVVNQYIAPEHLSPTAILWQHFPDLHLQPEQTWHYYYQQLMELQINRHGRFAQSRSAVYLEQLKARSIELDRHRGWQTISKLTSVEKSILEGAANNLLQYSYRKTSPQATNLLPGKLRIYLEGIFHQPPAPIDWRRTLKIFTATGVKTTIKNTIQRPSKRYGTVPGIKVRRRCKLLVAVDTSGSMRKEEIRLFFQEIHRLWQQGVEINLMECDTAMRGNYFYKGHAPSFVSGGGDTSFEAPIRYGNQHYRPDGLIYFTDGHARPPQIRARFPILWIISPQGITPESEAYQQLPGRKVKLVFNPE